MKHRKRGRRLKRGKDQNRALMKSLACSLIDKGKIKTTEAKAKELRPFIETLVTKARKEGLPSRRMVVSRLGSKESASKLIKDIAPSYKNRNGGYTRVVKLSRRRGDASKLAFIEFV